MTVLTVILGLLLIMGGVSCIMTPITTFLSTGYFIGVMFLVYGVAGIIKAFQRRSHALEVVISILAIAVGVISIIRPGSTVIFDQMILWMIAAWFIVQGIMTIVVSVKVKEYSKARWILGIIVGALAVIVGIYTLLHPLVGAATAGMLIGIYFIESGVNMLILGYTASALRDAIDDLQDGDI